MFHIHDVKQYVTASKAVAASYDDDKYSDYIANMHDLPSDPLELRLAVQNYQEKHPETDDFAFLIGLFEISTVSEPGKLIDLDMETCRRLAYYFTAEGNLLAAKVVDYSSLTELYKHVCPSLDIVARYYDAYQFNNFCTHWDNNPKIRRQLYLELCRFNRTDLVSQADFGLDLIEFAEEYGNQQIVEATKESIAKGRWPPQVLYSKN